MKWKSSTLNDHEGHRQPERSAILAIAEHLVFYILKNMEFTHWLIDFSKLKKLV